MNYRETASGGQARLIGSCVMCEDKKRRHAVQGLRHDGMPEGVAKWLCMPCTQLVQRQPGLQPLIEMCAASGQSFKDLTRIFARIGMAPPTDVDGVYEVLRRMAEAA